MSDTNLQPCPNPWCESKAEYVEERGIWFIVVCEYCGNRGPARKSREEATAAWNTRPAPALAPKQAAADTPEQMRERCFHDFLRIIQACMRFIDQEEGGVLQRFRGLVEQHGTPGLGTGTCDCGADDCPYKTASVPCDCGLPDCTDPRIAAAEESQAWICAKCGSGSVEHGMAGHPANACVYEPVMVSFSHPKLAAADEMAKALEAAETFIAEELACRRQSFEPDPQEHEKSYMGEAEQALSAVRIAIGAWEKLK